MTNLTTDPDAMRALAGRFDAHQAAVRQSRAQMTLSSENIVGSGWKGMAAATSADEMVKRDLAFKSIEDKLQQVSDGLKHNASLYEQREQESAKVLSS